MNKILLAGAIALISLIGCTDNTTGPSGSGSGVPVAVFAKAGTGGGSFSLGKSDGTTGTVDSIRVTYTIVVLKDIAFRYSIDTVMVPDSEQCEREDRDEHGGEDHDQFQRFRFKGPFVVNLPNNQPIQIALDTIPPGTYDGIRFKLHKLNAKDVAGNPLLPDSLVGTSVVVTGMVFYTGASTGTPFVFKANINEGFKVRGDFVVTEGTHLIPFVLDFRMDTWFDGRTRVLDPNNADDRRFIRSNIKHAFKDLLKGGRDMNHDGNPDD